MKNPTLLTLLNQGCTIIFPCGYSLHGDIRNFYIECSTEFGPDGLWDLSKEGLIKALNDVKKHEKDNYQIL